MTVFADETLCGRLLVFVETVQAGRATRGGWRETRQASYQCCLLVQVNKVINRSC